MAEAINNRWDWRDTLLVLLFFVTAVCVFTNLIFLVEWGVLNVEVGKKFVNKTLRIPTAVLFTCLGMVYYFCRNTFLKMKSITTVRSIALNHTRLVIFLLSVVYFIILVKVNFARHWALETRAFDLGIFAQAIWNTLQGDWLMSSIKGNISYLGDHASPILFLLAPIYSLWSDPVSLLVLQVFMTTFCVLPLSLIVWEKTNNRWLVLAFVFMYLIYAPSRSALHEDFHPEVLVEPFMFFAFYFLEKKQIKWFLINLFVVVLAKENMLGIAFAFGLYAFLFKGLKHLGIWLMVTAIIIFFLEVKWLIPYFSDGGYLYGASYDFAGLSISKAAMSILGDSDRWEYLLKVFLPFLFLPIFHIPTLLLALPVMFQNFLSENETMRSFSYHYTAGMTPFIFISSLHGYDFVCTRILKNEKYKALFVFLLLAVAIMRSGPSEYYYLYHSTSHITEHTELIREKLKEIPRQAVLLTHNNFIPQAVNRRHVYQFDYTDRISKLQQAKNVNADYVVFDKRFWEQASGELEDNKRAFLKGGYELEFEQDGLYILKAVYV